ncbi:HesA/MoeB/ThiF family protein [archaeon]|jgi:molybdopterin/thiamine biosynthesis adenylyltransferase|nr:HesA/MoeB/ThiF family protein [archaeon]MBT3450986.1 HesA/MoeB/ThiF family protein [archaeon]MBT6868594.1 HesA/MoeB/ThiF family protein [archaeon]MBT7193126.1 HesA/MoeB/ThiF family protein [archaeon]MBT7381106.1 HesA/MoeB/ThiF family protein [archaeon]
MIQQKQNNCNKELLERYSRQIASSVFNLNGQEALSNTKIAIVGQGALGTSTSELLVRAGIKKLILIDNDKIELSNLQRQCLFEEKDINKNKVITAKHKLNKINSNVKIKTYNLKLSQDNINHINELKNVDLILDCTDNFEIRFIINNFCKINKIPWIFSSAINIEGMIIFIHPEGPCLKCIFPDKVQNQFCSSEGILNTTTRIISSLQINLALNYILTKTYKTELIKVNSWNMKIDKYKVNKNKKCKLCQNNS